MNESTAELFTDGLRPLCSLTRTGFPAPLYPSDASVVVCLGTELPFPTNETKETIALGAYAADAVILQQQYHHGKAYSRQGDWNGHHRPPNVA